MSVRDDDPVQENISAASSFFPGGTHRSNQCKDSLRTPGPGAYRTMSSFPMSPNDEHRAHCTKRRGLSHTFTLRQTSRIVDIGNPFCIVPTSTTFFQSEAMSLGKSRAVVNTMPPCNSSHVILKGHGGDVPKGHGLPF